MKKLEHGVSRRIHEKVGELSEDPFKNAIKIAGEKSYRIRVGDYRVIFDIKQETLQVLVVKVGHMSTIYE